MATAGLLAQHDPATDGECVRRVDVRHAAQGQPGRHVHAHTCPRPVGFPPDEGIHFGPELGHRRSGGGVAHHVTPPFIKTQPDLEARRIHRPGALARGQPVRHQTTRGRPARLKLVEQLGALRNRRFHLGPPARGRQPQHRQGVRRVVIPRLLRRVAEKRGQRIKVPRSQGIKFVIVAGGAARRQAKEGHAKELHAVARLVDVDFLGNRPAFVRRQVAPHHAGRHHFLDRTGRQEVTRQLLNHKAIEGLVAIERIHHVIAIGPDRSVVVEVDTVRVRIPDIIEPVTRAVLTEARARKETIHRALVSPRGTVVQELLHLLRGRGKAGQVEGDPTQQRRPLGFGRGRQPRRRQRRAHKGIDRGRRTRGRPTLRNRRPTRRDERPVLLILRALRHPPPQRRHVLRLQGLVRLGRRHAVTIIR